MLTEEQRFALWRATMTDPVLVADRFSLTKQDLRAIVNLFDSELDQLPLMATVADLNLLLEKIPAPSYDPKLYEVKTMFDKTTGQPRERTEKEKKSLPVPPLRAIDALTATQKLRIHQMVKEANGR